MGEDRPFTRVLLSEAGYPLSETPKFRPSRLVFVVDPTVSSTVAGLSQELSIRSGSVALIKTGTGDLPFLKPGPVPHLDTSLFEVLVERTVGSTGDRGPGTVQISPTPDPSPRNRGTWGEVHWSLKRPFPRGRDPLTLLMGRDHY